MSVDYSKLAPGQQISSRSYVLDDETVSKYREAVEDASPARDADGRPLVPAMAVAALSLRGVIEDLAIPGGTLHAGQELRFSGVLAPNEPVDCEATLVQNSVRGGWRFLVVEARVRDGGGRGIMEGKSTIMLPTGE